MKRNLLSAVALAVALPFAAFAQAPASSTGSAESTTAAPAAKSESKSTESKTTTQADGSVKTEKKSTEKKAKKTAPRHKAAKRSAAQVSPAPAAN
jgi:hypothetical protein